MIIEHDCRKVELILDEPDKFSSCFYINNECILKLYVEKLYTLKGVEDPLPELLRNIATHFTNQGLYDNILFDIAKKIEATLNNTDIYTRTLPNIAYSDYYAYIPLVGNSDLYVNLKELGCYIAFEIGIKSKINENDVYVSCPQEKNYSFGVLAEITLPAMLERYNKILTLNICPWKQDVCYRKCSESGEEVESAYLVKDYDVNFLACSGVVEKIYDVDYLSNIKFLETGHLFKISKEQRTKLAKMKISHAFEDLDDTEAVIIKAIHPDGTVEF